MHITQIMIADSDTEFTHLLCRALRATEGFAVSGSYQTATGLEAVVRDTNPDILLLDLMLPDAFTALRELNTRPERQRPCIFALSSFVSAELSAECDRLGVNFFLRKPVSISSLVDILSHYGTAARLSLSHSKTPTQYDIVLQIRHLLNNLQFPAHVMGYRYLRDGILMTIEDPAVADSVTKLLYTRVERREGFEEFVTRRAEERRGRVSTKASRILDEQNIARIMQAYDRSHGRVGSEGAGMSYHPSLEGGRRVFIEFDGRGGRKGGDAGRP